MVQATAIFDSSRDKKLIAAGTHFWCEAWCLVARPINDQSRDPRYCQSCYDFLRKETEVLHPSRKPSWVPRPQKSEAKNQCPNQWGGALFTPPAESDSGTVRGKTQSPRQVLMGIPPEIRRAIGMEAGKIPKELRGRMGQ